MRVGYLNMSNPGATCPPGITLRQFNNKGLWALLFFIIWLYRLQLQTYVCQTSKHYTVFITNVLLLM